MVSRCPRWIVRRGSDFIGWKGGNVDVLKPHTCDPVGADKPGRICSLDGILRYTDVDGVRIGFPNLLVLFQSRGHFILIPHEDHTI